MITINNVKTLTGNITNLSIPSNSEQTIDAQQNLLAMPSLLDPFVCFGPMKDESWVDAVHAFVQGGITTVIDIPHPGRPCLTKKSLEEKKQRVEKKLTELKIPFNYLIYSGLDLDDITEIGIAKKLIKGIYIPLNPETIAEITKEWDRVFQLAAWEDLPIIMDFSRFFSSKYEDRFESEALLQTALNCAEKQNTRLGIFNVTTKDQLNLIHRAKQRPVLINVHVSADRLFKNNSNNTDYLWDAINSGLIDMVGSGYNIGTEVHFSTDRFYSSNPSFLLPQLLTAYHQGKISLDHIALTGRVNAQNIYELQPTQDIVLVDLQREKSFKQEGKGKEIKLKGWPVYTIVGGQLFPCFEEIN